MGYEGLVLLNVDGTNEDMALATGSSVPRARTRMESSAGYGGQISLPVDKMGIGAPETYDWNVYDGSIDLELTLDFYDRQIEEWIFDRQKAGKVQLQSRADNVQLFNSCYWSGISISASDGGLITSSINFVAMSRDSYIIGGGYIDNNPGVNGSAKGNEVFCEPQTFGVPSPFRAPIPYWNSSVSMDGTLREFVTWTVDLSQDVVKFFSCEVNANPVAPRFVAVGPMSVNFSGDYMFTDGLAFTIPNFLPSLYVTLGGGSIIKLEDLELQTDTDAVQSPDTLTPIALEYSAYTLVR
jgi:hypothetical protein